MHGSARGCGHPSKGWGMPCSPAQRRVSPRRRPQTHRTGAGALCPAGCKLVTSSDWVPRRGSSASEVMSQATAVPAAGGPGRARLVDPGPMGPGPTSRSVPVVEGRSTRCRPLTPRTRTGTQWRRSLVSLGMEPDCPGPEGISEMPKPSAPFVSGTARAPGGGGRHRPWAVRCGPRAGPCALGGSSAGPGPTRPGALRRGHAGGDKPLELPRGRVPPCAGPRETPTGWHQPGAPVPGHVGQHGRRPRSLRPGGREAHHARRRRRRQAPSRTRSAWDEGARWANLRVLRLCSAGQGAGLGLGGGGAWLIPTRHGRCLPLAPREGASATQSPSRAPRTPCPPSTRCSERASRAAQTLALPCARACVRWPGDAGALPTWSLSPTARWRPHPTPSAGPWRPSARGSACPRISWSSAVTASGPRWTRTCAACSACRRGGGSSASGTACTCGERTPSETLPVRAGQLGGRTFQRRRSFSNMGTNPAREMNNLALRNRLNRPTNSWEYPGLLSAP